MRQDTITTKHRTKLGRKVATTRQFQELTVPYHFSDLARRRGEHLEVSDYVTVRGLDRKYELVDIYPQFGSVRVREIGKVECLLLPWTYVTPWKNKVTSSKTALRAVGNWLFGGSKVYLLSAPGRMLRQRKIHWDRQSCDVEDADGEVLYDVPWDDLEFWDPVEYNLPDDE